MTCSSRTITLGRVVCDVCSQGISLIRISILEHSYHQSGGLVAMVFIRLDGHCDRQLLLQTIVRYSVACILHFAAS